MLGCGENEDLKNMAAVWRKAARDSRFCNYPQTAPRTVLLKISYRCSLGGENGEIHEVCVLLSSYSAHLMPNFALYHFDTV
jgi:hypothetical protein